MGTLRKLETPKEKGVLRSLRTGEVVRPGQAAEEQPAARRARTLSEKERQARTLEAVYRAQTDLALSQKERQARTLEAVYQAKLAEKAAQSFRATEQPQGSGADSAQQGGVQKVELLPMSQKQKADRYLQDLDKVQPEAFWMPPARPKFQTSTRKYPTVLERVGNAFSGYGKNRSSKSIDAMGTLYQAGQGGRDAMTQDLLEGYQHQIFLSERALTEMLAKDGLSYEELLAGLPRPDGFFSNNQVEYLAAQGVSDPGGVLMEMNVLMAARRNAGALGLSMAIQPMAGEATRELAAEIQKSGAEDIEAAKKGLGPVGRGLVDVGANLAQLVGDAALAKVGIPGDIPLALRTFGGATMAARQDGADLDGQLLYAGVASLKEVILNHFFNIQTPLSKIYGGGSLNDAVGRAIDTAVDRFAKTAAGKEALRNVLTWGASNSSEALEEAIGDWMEWKMPLLYGGDAVSWQEMLKDSLYDALISWNANGLFTSRDLVGSFHSAGRGAVKDANAVQTSRPNTDTVGNRAPRRNENGAFARNGGASLKSAARADVDTNTARGPAGRSSPQATAPEAGNGSLMTPAAQETAKGLLPSGRAATGQPPRPGHTEPETRAPRDTAPGTGPDAAALTRSALIQEVWRQRRADLTQYELDLDWAMDPKEQISLKRKILEAREDLFQYERELTKPGMTEIQKRLEDLARYEEELEWTTDPWDLTIDPWEQSFWEEMIARARADLKRYGYNN